MADFQAEHPGAMVAVIGLSEQELDPLRSTASVEGSIALANINAPGQIVVWRAGAVAKLGELAGQAGAERVVPIAAGAAFHGELMRPVQAQMSEAMAGVHWCDPLVPIAVNAYGRIVRPAEELRDALAAEIASPVRWVDCVGSLVEAGCYEFLELGPGPSGGARASDRARDGRLLGRLARAARRVRRAACRACPESSADRHIRRAAREPLRRAPRR